MAQRIIGKPFAEIMIDIAIDSPELLENEEGCMAAILEYGISALWEVITDELIREGIDPTNFTLDEILFSPIIQTNLEDLINCAQASIMGNLGIVI